MSPTRPRAIRGHDVCCFVPSRCFQTKLRRSRVKSCCSKRCFCFFMLYATKEVSRGLSCRRNLSTRDIFLLERGSLLSFTGEMFPAGETWYCMLVVSIGRAVKKHNTCTWLGSAAKGLPTTADRGQEGWREVWASGREDLPYLAYSCHCYGSISCAPAVATLRLGSLKADPICFLPLPPPTEYILGAGLCYGKCSLPSSPTCTAWCSTASPLP